MARYVEVNYYKRKQAIEDALAVLGEPVKNLILSYLYHNNKIIIESNYCSPIEEIQKALEELLGSSAVLIMRLIEVRDFDR